MKTTYKSKNDGVVGTEAESQDQIPSGALADTFLDLQKKSEVLNKQQIKKVSSGVGDTLEKAYEKEIKKGKAPDGGGGKKKKSKLPIILCVVLLLAVIGGGGYMFIQKSNQEKLLAEYEAFVGTVSNLYVQIDSGTQVDTTAHRNGLAGYELEGIDVSAVIAELDAIDKYQEDLGKLMSLEVATVNLLGEEFMAVLEEVESSADMYVVADLRVKIKEKIFAYEDTYEGYIALRDTIYNDTEFSRDKYTESVNVIVYDLQRTELLKYFDYKEAQIALQNANAKLAEVNVPVENEDVPDNKLKRADREKKAADIEARDLAVAEAQSVVDAAEMVLYECEVSWLTAKDAVTGGNEAAARIEEWEADQAAKAALEEAEESEESEE